MSKLNSAAHRAKVFPSGQFFVISGANQGDDLGPPEDMCLGDVYRLADHAVPVTLAFGQPEGGVEQPIAEGSEVGRAGDRLVCCAELRLMSSEGERVEVLVLQLEGGYYALPLSPIAPRRDYTLLSVNAPSRALRLADMICLSFHRGTRIALASGEQVAIEALREGMRVLTRDHGPQPIRWIGRATLRAVGQFAPVVITRGTMENEGDLIVGPHHRLFLYRRERLPGLARAELLIQAQHLVDGERVYRREGGFAEYFSLVFDNHEIIYAEGIPVESLMVNEASVASLPAGLAEELRRELPELRQVQHIGLEPAAELAKALHKRAPKA